MCILSITQTKQLSLFHLNRFYPVQKKKESDGLSSTVTRYGPRSANWLESHFRRTSSALCAKICRRRIANPICEPFCSFSLSLPPPAKKYARKEQTSCRSIRICDTEFRVSPSAGLPTRGAIISFFNSAAFGERSAGGAAPG